jgi:hypothetical protein
MQTLNKIGALLRSPMVVPDVDYVNEIFTTYGAPEAVTSVRKVAGGFVVRTNLKTIKPALVSQLVTKFHVADADIEIAIRGFRLKFKF